MPTASSAAAIQPAIDHQLGPAVVPPRPAASWRSRPGRPVMPRGRGAPAPGPVRPGSAPARPAAWPDRRCRRRRWPDLERHPADRGQRAERDARGRRDRPGAMALPGMAIQVMSLAVSVTGVPPWIVVSGWVSFCWVICGAQSSADSGYTSATGVSGGSTSLTRVIGLLAGIGDAERQVRAAALRRARSGSPPRQPRPARPRPAHRRRPPRRAHPHGARRRARRRGARLIAVRHGEPRRAHWHGV